MGNRALIVIAALTAICSVALLVGLNGAYAPGAAPKGVVNTTRAIDVTEAAAYAATSADTIEIKNYAFAPADVTVPLGTTVTWVNEDTVPHTVTSKSGPAKFDSGQMSSGASWSATFATAGTYDYYCVDHPQMVAKITVAPGGTPPPTSSSAPPTTHPTTAPTTHPTSASTHPTTPSSPPVSTPGGSGTSTPPTTAPTSAPTSAPTGTPTSAPSTAQSSPPASTPSSSMSMPGGPTGGGQCGLNQIIGTLVQHVDSAHLGESPGQQVQDLTNLNQYVLSHTTLVANLLTPLLNGATGAADGALIPLLQHVNATHLGESPGQQVQDLMNLDQYVLTHTTLVANMLTPAEGLLTGAC
ncbi:MAG: cupredoxin family copper-binding protein [Catenulispora sp.]|nr:cupredoxin family copper-binding protein [Catenulispora sp.]